jgi:glutathione peroxidase
LAVFGALASGVALAQEKGTPAEKPSAVPMGPLAFTMRSIDGQDVPLSRYTGKVVLIVNVASKCGLTPQYEQLEALHKKYGAQGLCILAFPANNFNGQEPGTNAEIKQFCTNKYAVSFDLFEKISVKGADQHPLYSWLTSADKNAGFSGDIAWNFTKFLVGRDGKVVARFEPRVKPDDAQVLEAIAKALAAKPAENKAPADDAKAPAKGS